MISSLCFSGSNDSTGGAAASGEVCAGTPLYMVHTVYTIYRVHGLCLLVGARHKNMYVPRLSYYLVLKNTNNPNQLCHQLIRK